MKVPGWKDDWRTTVAQYDPNPWGFYDMHGNIQEWVQDYYGEYTQYWYQDPRGPETGSARVVRGGGPTYSDTVPLTFSWVEDPRNPETGIVLHPTSAARGGGGQHAIRLDLIMFTLRAGSAAPARPRPLPIAP